MKVLIVNKTFGNFGGGCEKISYETGKILQEKGEEVFFFSSDKKPYYEENYEFSYYFPKDFENNIFNLFKLFYNFEAEKKLTQLIKTIKPDIVHVNGIHHSLTPSVLVACKKSKIPVVMTFHDSHFACPNAILVKGKHDYCENIDCINGNIISCLTNRCFNNSLIKSAVVGFEFLFRKLMNYYAIPDAYICPSNYLLDLAVKSGLKREKLFVVNHFLTNEYSDIKPSYSNKNYFLYVGRIVKEKGLEHLLKAFSELPNINLRIVGEGVHKNEFEQLAQELNMNNVEFVGFKNGDALKNEYKNCIATLLPSVCSEIFGLTILESFAYGKPVIAALIGGMPEIVQNNINGILVSPRSSEDIKAAVLKLYNKPEMVVNMGINARNTLEEKYTSDIYFEKIKSIYEHLTHKNMNDKTDNYISSEELKL